MVDLLVGDTRQYLIQYPLNYYEFELSSYPFAGDILLYKICFYKHSRSIIQKLVKILQHFEIQSLYFVDITYKDQLIIN